MLDPITPMTVQLVQKKISPTKILVHFFSGLFSYFNLRILSLMIHLSLKCMRVCTCLITHSLMDIRAATAGGRGWIPFLVRGAFEIMNCCVLKVLCAPLPLLHLVLSSAGPVLTLLVVSIVLQRYLFAKSRQRKSDASKESSRRRTLPALLS